MGILNLVLGKHPLSRVGHLHYWVSRIDYTWQIPFGYLHILTASLYSDY